LYLIARKLILYLIYIVLALIFYFIEHFAIFSTILDLYIKYNNVVLYYIYNSLNIKDCIAILICKQKLEKSFIKILLKFNLYIA